MERTVESTLIRCPRCNRGQGEHYEYFVLVRHRGLQTRHYGPGTLAIECVNCNHVNVVEITGKKG